MGPGPTLMERCVLGLDVQAYSQRNPRRQADIQRDLQTLLSEVATAVGLDRSTWELFPTGDGELVVLPADVDLLPVVADFVPALHKNLVLRNADRAPETKIRLRLAVHIDTLTPSTPGNYAGTALVTVSRLLDSAPVRAALQQAKRAELALILSTPVFEKVVLSGFVAMGEDDFVPVLVDLPAKNFTQTAHIHVPGYDMKSFPRTEATSAGRRGDERAQAADAPVPEPPTESAERDDRDDRDDQVAGPEPTGSPGSSSSVFGGAVIHGGVRNTGTIAGRDVHNPR